ncbi:hypothetical protein E4U57_006999 [Claviceps arundinis]|uniref:Uncharacterized protein n=1 Tax=Claviceps arundinis TaxID=1623583 RepID=A0A9P7SM64_9HYPO|nr:hypothetical protein E4U57_006999 [Claviceps arundinis]KAG5956553.1 hypothetical protein E4U56_006503 [Claviceps arundinis]
MTAYGRDLLHQTAADVIAILKTIPEFRDSKIAVIGGLALWKYLSDGRTTEDVDFIVNIESAPHGVKNRLLALENSPFVQIAQTFFYQGLNGRRVQVDVTHRDSSPYLPEAAIRIKDVQQGEVPYISVLDLIIFKIFSCGMRAQAKKRLLDATDAESLVLYQIKNEGSGIKLNAKQKEMVEPYIMDVVENGEKTEKWWRENLGL